MITGGDNPAAIRNLRILACVLLVALTIPRMWQHGMFLDGLIYASVSRNLAAGDGSLWAPIHTATDDAPFFEHPPLGFWLEAVGFRIVGDSFLVERGFSLLAFGLHALLIMAMWRRLLPARYDWIPLFFWILPEVVTWSVVNNMLENTQALFTTAAVYCLIRTIGERSTRNQCGWSMAAGVSVVAATLTKGPVGLFPIAVPLLLPLLPLLPRDQRPRRLLLVWTTMTAVVVAAAMTLAVVPAPRHALAEYFRRQLVPSLRGEREIASARFPFVSYLGAGILARIAIVAAALAAIPFRSFPALARVNPITWFFLLTGAMASLPIAASPKMAGHYFVPAVPFFALAAASFVMPAVDRYDWIRSEGKRHIPLMLAGALLVATIVVPVAHGPIEPRDLDTVASLDALASAMPRGAIVGTCRAEQFDWSFATYLQRFFRVSVEAQGAAVDGWFVAPNGACPPPPPDCQPAANGATMVLYRCSNSR
jgi:4-amino-4-deoxy-L-arabinose transferase-like glycosyltransferase